TTPVPRLRVASASRRMVENLKSFRNKMEPTAHTPSSSTSFSDPYAFTTRHQPVYFSPHSPRCRTWSHSECPEFIHQDGDGGSGIVILILIMIPVHALTMVTVQVMRFTVHRHPLMPMDLVRMTMGTTPSEVKIHSLFDELGIITTKIHSMIPWISIQVCLYLTTPIYQTQARIQV
ncbi:hypothetical protein DFH05DRAFT_1499030, partial [Lentinula detonsa]